MKLSKSDSMLKDLELFYLFHFLSVVYTDHTHVVDRPGCIEKVGIA
jgi:hypothetical protein